MHQHFSFYKPYGTLSQFINNGDSKRHHKLLGDWGQFPDGTMAIGRLDRDSEGLLLLTTDGNFSEKIRSKNCEKEYWVQVDGIPTSQQLKALRAGIALSHKGECYQTRPAQVQRIPVPELPPRGKPVRSDRHGASSWLKIIITEGKFRQVRKMTAKVGLPTLRLFRVRVGNYEIGGLLAGESRAIVIGQSKSQPKMPTTEPDPR